MTDYKAARERLEKHLDERLALLDTPEMEPVPSTTQLKHTPVTQSAFNELQRDMDGAVATLEKEQAIKAELLEALQWALQFAPSGAAKDRAVRIITKAPGK